MSKEIESFTMPSLFPVVLLALGVCLTFDPSLVVASHSNGSRLITQACQHATHGDLCLSLLQAEPNSQRSDFRGLALIALQLARKNASRVSFQIKNSLKNANLAPRVQQALTDCDVQYLDVVEKVENAMDAFRLRAYHDVDTWVNTAIADVQTCQKGVQGQTDQALRALHSNRIVHQLLNVSLGILHDLARAGNG